jgi:formyl-CoA transferase
MRQAEGQSILKELVTNADFLLENFRPGTMEKWGCGYEELAKINPRLIMIRVSGYGQTGPYAHQAGFGAIGEAMGGMRYVVGDPSTPPSRMGISIGDELAATFACLGALSALHYREKTGPGPGRRLGDLRSRPQHDGIADHRVRQDGLHPRAHRRHPAERGPVERLQDRDGLVLIAANQDTVFGRLCEAMGKPEWHKDAAS